MPLVVNNDHVSGSHAGVPEDKEQPRVNFRPPVSLSTWIAVWIARFGVHSTVTTDRGSQLEAHLFAALLALLGTTRIRTTSYRPSANGLVEGFHRQLKAAIMAHETLNHWATVLPVVLLGIRGTLKPDIACSPAELVYDTTLRLPAGFFEPSTAPATDPRSLLHDLHQTFAGLRRTPTRASSSRMPYVLQQLATAMHVFLHSGAVRKSLQQQPYSGPHPVLRRGDKFYAISINGKPDNVSVDRLKPAFTELSRLEAALLFTAHPEPSPSAYPSHTVSNVMTLEPPWKDWTTVL
ncbi:uncharacterized protein LOC135386421 [Ornithodoros turicata]|uniref:uncharacterized protein LOC135386421 n=1 Tax=Ornithodoros turicata TaxID=34597 RepID=UPI00313A1FEF